MNPKQHSPSNRSGTDHLRRVRAKISALVWDLRFFDVTTIRHPADPKGEELAARIDATLADIFGQHSQEYQDFSVRSFDTPPLTPGSGYPLPEVRQGYQRGIDTAAQKLNLLLGILDKKLWAAEGVAPPARQAGAAAASSDKEKISLVTIRAKLRNKHAPSTGVGGNAPGDGTRMKHKARFGVAVERVTGGQLDTPQPTEGTAGARNRGSAYILGKHKEKRNRPEVDKAGRASKTQKYEPPAAGQAGNSALEYLQPMPRAREAEGPGEEEVAAAVQSGTEEKENSRPLEPEGFVSPEFAYQEPCAGLRPDSPLSDAPGKEALVPVDEAIVFGDDELPATNAISTLVEDIETVLGVSVEPQPSILFDIDPAPEMLLAELTVETCAEHAVEPSMALTSLDQPKLAEVTMTAGEENDFQGAAFSALLDEEGIGDIETGLPELSERAVADAAPSQPLQEESAAVEHGPCSHAATEQAIEPLWHEITADELLSVEQRASEPERSKRGINLDAVEDELPAIGLEQAKEPISVSSLDLCDVDALADKFAKEIAGPPEPKARGAPGERLSGDAVRIPAGFDQCSEETSSGAAEALVEAVTEPVVKAPEVEQNPFAVRDFEKKQSRPKATEAVDLRAQIKAIMERINDLRSFDVSTVTERFDPRALELRDSVNTTIADIFGGNTPVYWRHSLPSFDAARVVLGSPKPTPDEVRGTYLKAINKAVTSLTAIMESLKHRIEKLKPGAIPENELLAPSVPDHEKEVMVVERQEEPPARAEPEVEVKEPTKEEAVERPGGRVVVKTPEVEQNPFAVRDFEKKQSRPKTTEAVDLPAQIKAIMERIDDLRSFDVTTVTDRFDPRALELRDSANNTIADVFGRNTPAYWRHSLPSFDAARVVVGSPKPSPAEVRGTYLKAINKAVTSLTAIMESLKHRLEQSEFPDSG